MDQTMSTIFMLVMLFVIMYFLMIRPENKRKKQQEEMRNSVKKGDVVTSIGGIVGKIVAVKNETIIIETSEDRVRMEITKWAISSIGVQSGDQPAEKKSKKEKEEAVEPAETTAQNSENN